MAVLWQASRIPQIDPNGDPYAGAKAYFYQSGTSTPLTVYQDTDLSEFHDSPVVANGSGAFPAIFLPASAYRERVTDADGNVLWDIDGIDAPQAASYTPPSAGSTSPELLASTGDVKARYGTGAHSGWVRCAGRTIGSAASGAAERANDDCQDLFEFLWAADSTLTVSGGRGASAANDWAADKTIALPDFRSRALVGLATMGNADVALIASALVDNSETADTLGATAGASTHALTEAELAAHGHTASTASAGSHTHTPTFSGGVGAYPNVYSTGGGATEFVVSGGNAVVGTIGMTSAGSHTHTVTVDDTGSGTAHNNVQPSSFVTFYLKL